MFGKNLKELRTEKGYTQAELAKEIGVSQGAIYFWEKEINEPTAGYLVKLADIFGVSVDELLSFECEKNGASPKTAEIASLFNRLSENQQNIILGAVKEMLKL